MSRIRPALILLFLLLLAIPNIRPKKRVKRLRYLAKRCRRYGFPILVQVGHYELDGMSHVGGQGTVREGFLYTLVPDALSHVVLSDLDKIIQVVILLVIIQVYPTVTFYLLKRKYHGSITSMIRQRMRHHGA